MIQSLATVGFSERHSDSELTLSFFKKLTFGAHSDFELTLSRELIRHIQRPRADLKLGADPKFRPRAVSNLVTQKREFEF